MVKCIRKKTCNQKTFLYYPKSLYFLHTNNSMNEIKKNLKNLTQATQAHGYRFGKAVDKIVNLCTYGVILSLVGYMIARILKSFAQIFQAIFSGVTEGGIATFSAPEEVLHTVPLTIILVKAYKVLLEYAKTQHINLKYVLEIAITAPVVEIIFNFTGYTNVQLIFMGAFCVIMTVLYLYFYKTIKEVEVDYSKQHENHD